MDSSRTEIFLYASDSRLKKRLYLCTCNDIVTAKYIALADSVSDFSAGLGFYRIHRMYISDIRRMTKQATAIQINIVSKSGTVFKYTYIAVKHAIPEQERLFDIDAE